MTPPVRDIGWVRSSRSGSGSQSCVEVRITYTAVCVRDSKNQTGPSFAVTNGAWNRFVAAVKDDWVG